jgi:acetylornithine/N-succinyldiaminopimelate aminotransferase
MLVAKGIGGGYPLGALLATEEAARGMTAGTHGSTYGGNPAGLRGRRRGDGRDHETRLPRRREPQGGLLRQRLEGLVAAHPDIFAACAAPA